MNSGIKISFHKIIFLILLLSWFAGFILNFNIFVDFSGKRDGFQEKIIFTLLLFAALYIFLFILNKISKIPGIHTVIFTRLAQFLLIVTISMLLIIDLLQFKPRVYSFGRMPDHQIDSLHKFQKYKEIFGPYYQNKPLLKGKKIYIGPGDLLDPRFISLSGLKEIRSKKNYTLPFDVTHLLNRYRFVEFPGGDTTYILLVDADTVVQNKFYLTACSSGYFILPENIVETYRDVGFAGGDGTRQNPYQIDTADHVNFIRFFPNSHFELTADINFAHDSRPDDNYFKPIGGTFSPFSGTLDGNGFSISNLHIKNPISGIAGLFSYTDEAAVIKNIRLLDVHIDNSIVIPNQGLMGEWLFNDTSDKIILDTSGPGNHAVNHGASPVKDSILGSSLLFGKNQTGQAAHLDLGFAPDIATIDGLTLSLWINLNSFRKGGTILGAGHTRGAYGLFEHDQQIIFGFRTNDSDSSFISFQPEQGRWYHLAAVYKHESFLRLYVNGQLAGEERPPSGSFTRDSLLVGSTGRLSGRRADASHLDGMVSRIHIYGKILDDHEITMLSSTGIAGSLAGINEGLISNVYSSGSVKGLIPGEIAGVNFGHIVDSLSEAEVIQTIDSSIRLEIQ